MKLFRLAAVLLLVAVMAAAVWYWAGRRLTGRSPDHLPKVPEGFEIELVAGPPLVDRPIAVDFDEQGRLYVADSSGSSAKAQKQLEERPHRIVRLEDSDGDGRFDKSVVFADRMMFPEGTLWFDGSLYVTAPPSIWKLTDTNGDGVADQREEWFQGKTLTNCANDLHGPFLGLDGWIYWCKGAFAEQTHEREGLPPLVTRASHIFRRRPGTSAVETVMTGGMDNPVDIAFTPQGERILTATFVQQPEAGLRDGLIHAIYGGVYGKKHGVIDGHKRTGDLMPVLSHLGPAVPCGLTRYSSDGFGEGYRDNLFVCLFNLHKVTRHVLEPAGSTFKTHDTDFVSSDNSDFHPTDVLEDADGSLLVINTGGWYKICCPSSQLAKPDVLGAIYRIRRKGASVPRDARGLKLNWAAMGAGQLADLLSDDRSAVYNRAIHQLGKLGHAAVPALSSVLKNSGSAQTRRNALWALTRVEDPAARAAVRTALSDPDAGIRQAAAHSAGVWRDGEALEQLAELLRSGTPAVRRAAAEALGRVGDRRAVAGLLAAAAERPDRVLEHSLVYALIEIADPAATAGGLQSASSDTQRAALVALDQMDGGGLKPDTVTPLLTSQNETLRQTAWWIVEQNPDWGAALADFFRARVAGAKLAVPERQETARQMARLAGAAEIQKLLASMARSTSDRDWQLAALEAMSQAPLKVTPAAWTAALADLAVAKDPEVASRAIAAVRALRIGPEAAGLRASLLQAGRDATKPADLRLRALAAAAGGIGAVDSQLFEFLSAHAAPSQPLEIRGGAADVLARASLSTPQLLTLTGTLQEAGPLELPKLLACYEKASDPQLGLRLIDALQRSKGRTVLRADVVRPRLAGFPADVQKKGEELLAALDLDSAQQRQRLETLLAGLQGGDVRRGQAVFNGAKAACSSCHAIGYLGGRLGPDLTRIGQIRTERDLLEAIVFPSISFVRSYEPVVIRTRSGEIHNGVIRNESADEIIVATGANTEERIAHGDIADLRPSTVSVMPTGMDEQLSRQELADLLAFLKNTRRSAYGE